MKRAAVVAVYVLVFFVAGIYLDNLVELVFSAAAAAAFSISYVNWASGSRTVAFATVVIVTLVIPVVALMLMAAPTQPSWWHSLKMIVQVSIEHGDLSGLDWFVPLVAAATGIVLSRYLPVDRRTDS